MATAAKEDSTTAVFAMAMEYSIHLDAVALYEILMQFQLDVGVL